MIQTTLFEQRTPSMCTLHTRYALRGLHSSSKAMKELNTEGHAIMAAKDAKLKAIRTPELRLIKTISNDESGRSR